MSTIKKKAAWRVYQDEVASFFRGVGFDAETDVPVEGARGGNNIDVEVRGVAGGIPFKWLVECKHWKTNVPREKAQAFLTVVQNAGADRGYLLSEKGFQSGAFDVVRHTNVYLGSVAALREDTASWSQVQQVRRWRERKGYAVRALLKMHKETGKYLSGYSEAAGSIFGIDTVIEDGLDGAFPVPFHTGELAIDWNDLVEKIEAKLDNAEKVAGLTPNAFLSDPFGLQHTQ